MSWRFYHNEIVQLLCTSFTLAKSQVTEILELTKLRDVSKYGEFQCSVDKLLRLVKLSREELEKNLEETFQEGNYEIVKSSKLITFRIRPDFLFSNTLGNFLSDTCSLNQVSGVTPKRVGLWRSDSENWRGQALETFTQKIHQHLGFQVLPVVTYLGDVEDDFFGDLDLDKEKLRVNQQLTKLGVELATFHGFRGKVEVILYIGEDHLKQHIYQLNQLMKRISQDSPEIQHIPYGPLIQPTLDKNEILAGSRVEMQALMKESESRYVDLMETSIKINESEEICLLEWISEVLAETNWLVQLLQVRRQKPSKFEYARMLDAKGHSGVYLQYTHARISGIERKSEINLNLHCPLTTLVEPEARHLAWLLATYSWHVEQAFTTLEPCILIHYLFLLGIGVSNGLSVLRVKGKNPKVSEPRWRLFWCAREILRHGFEMVGIQGLDKM